MYHILKEVYCWEGMKNGMAQFVAKYTDNQQDKIEHQRSEVLAQNIELLEWKWEIIEYHHGITMVSLGA